MSAGTPNNLAMTDLPFLCSAPALSSMMVKTNNTMMAPA